MASIIQQPAAIFLLSLALQWLAAYLGHVLRRRRPLGDAERADFNTILGATLTLAALIIGFSFSMAVSRYNERKAFEGSEANAILTAYARAPLLPPAQAVQTRRLLARYTELRVQFYGVSDPARLARIAAETEQVQDDLQSIANKVAVGQPSTETAALAATAMTDVSISQRNTQAAWWNRIPAAAWGMLLVIAFAANFLLGASERRTTPALLVVLPLIISAPILLIADIDAPRAGFILVAPDDLTALSHWIAAHP